MVSTLVNFTHWLWGDLGELVTIPSLLADWFGDIAIGGLDGIFSACVAEDDAGIRLIRRNEKIN